MASNNNTNNGAMVQAKRPPLLDRMMVLFTILLLAVLYTTSTTDAFTVATTSSTRRRTLQTLLLANKAKKAGSSDNAPFKGMGKKDAAAPPINWCPTPITSRDLPTAENTVAVLATNLPSLKNGQTNPNSAVAVIKYDGQTYCFDAACPACKIPLTKAKCRTIPDPDEDPKEEYVIDVITCDFCKTTYELQTGVRQKESAMKDEMGFFGGITSKVFAANSASAGPLKFYKLGEKDNGQVVIAVD
jgi:nitrite reductase/ring-hydroxylating ferredoxin subunit